MIQLHAHPLPPLPTAGCLSFSVFLCVAGPAYWRERGRRGWAWSWIKQPQERLASIIYSLLSAYAGSLALRTVAQHIVFLATPSRYSILYMTIFDNVHCPVLGICDIPVLIRIPESERLAHRSGSNFGSDSFFSLILRGKKYLYIYCEGRLKACSKRDEFFLSSLQSS